MVNRLRSLAFALLLLQHGMHLFFFLGGTDIWQSPLPILVHDHAYVAYNGKVAARALRHSWTTAAYEPRYMAGYVNSFVSSSNGVLPFVVLAAGEGNAGVAYKCYCWCATMSLPVLVYWAARLFGLNAGQATVSMAVWLFAFWGSGKAWRYIDYGMIAFVTSLGWVPVIGGLTARFFDWPSCWRSIAMGIVAGIGCLWHTTTAILIAPGCFALLVWHARRLSLAAWMQLLLAVGICLAVNAPWLATMPTVWPTLGDTPRFFVNPNVVERLVDILRLDDESVTVPLLIAAGGAVPAFHRFGRSALGFLGVSLAWTFFLAYPAGWIRALDVLQPGRNTFAFATWLCIPAGGWLAAVAARGRSRWWALTMALVAGCYVQANLPSMIRNSLNVATSTLHRMPSRLPALHAQMFADIRGAFRDDRRIFYEDCNVGVANEANPFYTFRPSPLAAELAAIEIIGGPYLQTHYRTRDVQAGDGKLFGKTEWTDAEFDRWTEAYDIAGIVCWSQRMTSFCLARPKRFVQRFARQDGVSGATIYGFSLASQAESWLPEGVRVLAAIDRITIEVAGGSSRRLRLPYHWQPGLVAPPSTVIRPVARPDCPVPFIEVDAPPGETVIRFDPFAGWKRKAP